MENKESSCLETDTQVESEDVLDNNGDETDALEVLEAAMDRVELSANEPAKESKFEQDLNTDGGKNMIESLEETDAPDVGQLIDDLLSREDSEEEDEPLADVKGEKTSSSPTEPVLPTETEKPELSINVEKQTELLHEMQEDNEKLSQLSSQLQTSLSEYFSNKSGYQHATLDKEVSVEENYQKFMNMIAAAKMQQQIHSELHKERVEELLQQSTDKQKQVQHELRSFNALQHEAVVAALTGKVGKQQALSKVEQHLADELKLEDKLASVRLNNIKLKNQIYQYETTLRSRRELVGGLMLMDFEQLRTENQAFKDKLEERNEELHQLKKKVACSVQAISHVKEKLHFMQIENKGKHSQLVEKDALVALQREQLKLTRQARDALRLNNLDLQERSGLLGNTTLLKDFEEKVDASENLELHLQSQKRRHAELMLKCAGLKQKIQQSKPAFY